MQSCQQAVGTGANPVHCLENSSGFVYPAENTAVLLRLSSHQLREPNVNTLEQ